MSSPLVANIIAALQAVVNAEWTAQGLPGSPPTIGDSIGGMSAIYDTLWSYIKSFLDSIQVIVSASGAALNLPSSPAGATYIWFGWEYSASTGAMTGQMNAAGYGNAGAQILDAASAGAVKQSIIMRLS